MWQIQLKRQMQWHGACSVNARKYSISAASLYKKTIEIQLCIAIAVKSDLDFINLQKRQHKSVQRMATTNASKFESVAKCGAHNIISWNHSDSASNMYANILPVTMYLAKHVCTNLSWNAHRAWKQVTPLHAFTLRTLSKCMQERKLQLHDDVTNDIKTPHALTLRAKLMRANNPTSTTSFHHKNTIAIQLCIVIHKMLP